MSGNEARVEGVLRSASDLVMWRRLTRDFTLQDLEYAADRHTGSPDLSSPYFQGEWIEQSRRELIIRTDSDRIKADFKALRDELVKAKEHIKAGNDLIDAVKNHHEDAARKEAYNQDEKRRWRVATEKTAEHRYRLNLWWGAVTFFAGGIVVPKLAQWLAE